MYFIVTVLVEKFLARSAIAERDAPNETRVMIVRTRFSERGGRRERELMAK